MMENVFDDDARVIQFLADYRGVLTSESFFASGTIVDTAGAPSRIDHAALVEDERAEYVEGKELGDGWIFDPNKPIEVEVVEEAEEVKAESVEADPLDGLSAKDLKKEAKALGLTGYSRFKAPELRDVIREAQAENEAAAVEEAAEGE